MWTCHKENQTKITRLIFMNFSDKNNREKQGIGAICILLFCNRYSIFYKGISELVEHLFSMLTSENLPEWNKNGLKIEIVARGDSLPNELDVLININLKKDFFEMVDNVVEIGIIDMFGNDTNYPSVFLNKTLSILKKHNINLDIPDNIFLYKNNTSSWG
jgi:hypothetical protein